MYSFPNLEPVHCSMSGFSCCFLPCTQISQETDKVIWFSHLFKNFPQFVVIHTVKSFSVVNEADVVFWNSSAFSVIQWMLEIWPLVHPPFLSSARTPGTYCFMYSWSLAWGTLSIISSHVTGVQLCSSVNLLCHCLSLGLEWNLTFSSPMANAEFSKFAGILSKIL